MELERKRKLKKEIALINAIKAVGRGFISMFNKPVHLIVMTLVLIIDLMMWVNRDWIVKSIQREIYQAPSHEELEICLFIIIILTIPIILHIFGRPIRGYFMAKGFERTGLVNAIGEVPILIDISRAKDNKRARVLKFEICGWTLSEWQDKQFKIESAINYNISKILQGEDNRRITIKAIPAKYKLPINIKWDYKYLSPDDGKLTLGENLTGKVYWDLSVTPHGLIGGSTGSGKTFLLKCLLAQCIKKGNKVYIADFKGGVDFNSWWEANARVITDKQALINCLENLTYILEDRKKVLKLRDCKNITEYNQKHQDQMERVIFACDEIAAVLDKTGLNSEDKKMIGEIENYLSQIARQGRAFGINLILGTQRPDATIIPPQVRSNCDYRVCGRADDILSKIILDNTSASDAVPIDVAGRFMTGDGTIFQGYYLEC